MKSFFAVVSIFLIGNFAMAQSQGSMDGSGPCHGDIQQYCKDVKPGKGGIMKCLKDNKEKVSAGCKSQIDEMKEKRKEMRKSRNKGH